MKIIEIREGHVSLQEYLKQKKIWFQNFFHLGGLIFTT